jgi:hypothetical protein
LILHVNSQVFLAEASKCRNDNDLLFIFEDVDERFRFSCSRVCADFEASISVRIQLLFFPRAFISRFFRALLGVRFTQVSENVESLQISLAPSPSSAQRSLFLEHNGIQKATIKRIARKDAENEVLKPFASLTR